MPENIIKTLIFPMMLFLRRNNVIERLFHLVLYKPEILKFMSIVVSLTIFPFCYIVEFVLNQI